MATSEPQDSAAERLAPYLPSAGEVTVFSAEWCGYCTALKKMLRHTEITYREVLIEEDAAAEQIAADANGGDWIIPTVLYPDGSTAVNPGVKAVAQRLAELSASPGDTRGIE